MFRHKGLVFGAWVVAMVAFYFVFRRPAANEMAPREAMPQAGGMAGGGMPAAGGEAGAMNGANRGAENAGGTIHGKISIAPALKDKAKAGDTLFIIARKSEVGPPLAAKRETVTTFPLDYTLSSDNVMMQGSAWSGDVVVTVRVDKDGNATTKTPGDLTGKTKPVSVGTQDANIVIDEQL